MKYEESVFVCFSIVNCIVGHNLVNFTRCFEESYWNSNNRLQLWVISKKSAQIPKQLWNKVNIKHGPYSNFDSTYVRTKKCKFGIHREKSRK